MPGLLSTAGMKISIGPAKSLVIGSDFTAADFPANTVWTLIGGTTNIGGAGDTSELITSNHIMTQRTRKVKGTRNAGTMELVCDLDMSDAGQIALVAAERSSQAFAFKVEFNDAPATGSNPKPSTRFFAALVMSAREQYDEANSIIKLNTTLEIDSNIVLVAASAS